MPQNEDCLFCPEPDRITEWFHEDDVCLLINKPTGEPMVVLKRHTTEPTDEEMEHMQDIVQQYCGNHELQVILAHVPNHWHGHIIDYDQHPDEQ